MVQLGISSFQKAMPDLAMLDSLLPFPLDSGYSHPLSISALHHFRLKLLSPPKRGLLGNESFLFPCYALPDFSAFLGLQQEHEKCL